MTNLLRRLGPGLLFAGAAIGVSHLVQSTKAGAAYGLGLIWALLLVNLFKYPFFQYAPRYTAATKETILDGYKRLGRGVILAYFILSLGSMFTIQAAVTIVTAGIANALFGEVTLFGINNLGFSSIEIWTIVILSTCTTILIFGRYKNLDRLIKSIIIMLSLSTIVAVIVASANYEAAIIFKQIWPIRNSDIVFLIAFMGWMPAPIDISIFHSLWSKEEQLKKPNVTVSSSLFDFNIGYVTTVMIGILFLILGYTVMYNSGESFSANGGEFANQLISMYTKFLGNWSFPIIGAAALTAMFSTTITTLDASPRAMAKSVELLGNIKSKYSYVSWLIILTFGTLFIFLFLASEMGSLIEIATILSFVTAPFYAGMNFWLITSRHTPKTDQPKKGLIVLSWLGLIFLSGFGIWYLSIHIF